MAVKPQGDWVEYRSLILGELKRLNEGIEGVKVKMDQLHARDIGDIRSEIAVLKFKSGLWGFAAGAIPSAVAAAYMVLHK